jgi:hypothetical protein
VSRTDVTVADLTELLHDAILQHGEWEPAHARLRLTFSCLRSDDDAKLPVVDLVLSGVVAIAASYDPTWPEDRPSAFRVPDGCMIQQLSPWPLTEGEVEATADSTDACDDLELAARTDWLTGDLRATADARHRLVLRSDCGLPHIRRWITIAFADVTPLADGKPLPWQDWGEQYNAWWRAWSEHCARERGHVTRPAPAQTTYRIAEPVIDLEANDVPAALLAVVAAWFETQHLRDDETAQLVYARSITSWWIEGRRANVIVTGVEHYPPEADEPAESIVTTYSFELCRRGEVWQVRTWTSREADGPMPAWAARWTTGRVQLR